MSVRLSCCYFDSRIHGMYSKHSALGSRIFGTIQNNDVTSSSPRGLFQNDNQKQDGYRRRPSNVRRKRVVTHSWSREETLLLVALYEEMNEMFQNIDYEKKQV